MTSLFAVGFGGENREKEILKYLEHDPTVALILASVHFEWTIKRAILKLSTSPTRLLRQKIEDTYLISPRNNQLGLDELWHQEIGIPISNASFKKIVGNLSQVLGDGGAKSLRGKIIHGNGTISKIKASEAIGAYFKACNNVRKFVKRCGKNLDERLTPRK